jgi:hypothetical protein
VGGCDSRSLSRFIGEGFKECGSVPLRWGTKWQDVSPVVYPDSSERSLKNLVLSPLGGGLRGRKNYNLNNYIEILGKREIIYIKNNTVFQKFTP